MKRWIFEGKPWVVMTTCATLPVTVGCFEKRFGIEPMHKAWKTTAFDLEDTRVTDPKRIATGVIPDLLTDEQRSIVKNDIEALRASILDQEKLSSQIRDLERMRIQATDAIRQQLGIETDRLTIKTLTRLIEGSQSARLEEVGNTLLDLQRKIETASRNNELLIKQSMRYIDRSLNILTGAGKPAPVYAKSGKVEQEGGKRGVVDKKA